MKIEKRKRINIDLFPVGEPENSVDWQKGLTGTRIQVHNGNPELERILIAHWEIVLRWVAKLKWRNPNLLIPTVEEAATLKPQAEVILAILNLCTELHVLGFGAEYPNAAAWFRDLCLEFQCAIRSDFYHGSDFLIGKNRRSSIGRAILKGENPFRENSCFLDRLCNLASVAVGTQESHPSIFDDLYKGHQRQKPHKGLGAAFSAWQTAIDRQPSTAIGFDRNMNLLTNGKQGIAKLQFTDS